jgi:hypothetical protein
VAHDDDRLEQGRLNTDETFDHVLVMNVIHYIRNVDDFLARAARLAARRLVVEFPMLRTRSSRPCAAWTCTPEANALPLIQTYVFAPEAIGGIGGFARVDAAPSLIANRSILIFTR